ncbi:MAG: GtrA family protein [Comamonadaceae bacterium CG_4_9_14_3_um_filter_60_33]|nr:MAG: polysaccharide synthesis protein GtrA [Comamonadaceae bacterium CG2_30_59_20]PIY29096.1 MAG: GtrA family protein [Comamonadaceae bacterium CG_4_10_14_3_um_filter_60_42]PJB44830.1 MAG: GtrA family protein [Comamonadaceae bacterium CG_4_9_14_3_um_filter_60_33]
MASPFKLRMRSALLLRRIFSRRFLKFGTVGASGTVVNIGVLYLAQEFLFNTVQTPEVRLNLSLALAIFLATLNNFSWNRLWTWVDRKHYLQVSWLAQFGQYALACSLSIVLQIVFTNLLAPHFYYQIANLIAIGVTSVLNFLLNDIWTFGRTRLMGAARQRSR